MYRNAGPTHADGNEALDQRPDKQPCCSPAPTETEAHATMQVLVQLSLQSPIPARQAPSPCRRQATARRREQHVRAARPVAPPVIGLGLGTRWWRSLAGGRRFLVCFFFLAASCVPRRHRRAAFPNGHALPRAFVCFRGFRWARITRLGQCFAFTRPRYYSALILLAHQVTS